jgi:hypothetical protein
MKAFLLAVGLGIYPALAAGLNYGILQRACIRGAIPVPPFLTAPIPVGCELVDCCPGCPGPGPIEWRIRLDSTVATSAELRFEGLSKEQVGKLKISGAAKRDGERILLRSGSARIVGIPHGAGTPVAVGMLQPVASEQAARRLPKLLGGAQDLTDRILVEQFMGPFLVNSFSWTWVPRPCIEPPKPPALGQDRLKVDGIAAGDEVSVMLYGRRNAGCMNGTSSAAETAFSTTGEKWLGNVLSAGSCHSEVAVFSKKHRMKWQPLDWTDVPGDLRTVTLEPLIEADLKIWITDEVDRIVAEEHAQTAQDLFLENRVGVRLNWKVEHVANVQDAPPNAVAIVNAGLSNDLWVDCQNLAAIRAHKFYVANTLNVYYLRRTVPGRNCAIRKVPTMCIRSPMGDFQKEDANINFIGTDANPTTLVHELGHAYGLRPLSCHGHPPLADFGAENIMYSSASSTVPRSKLTLGQVFRMNTHDDDWGGTMLIPNNIPARTPRKCFPDLFDAGCPRLKVQWP